MTISTSDLDFANIKTKLKTFLKQSGEFDDYDFEASGVSNILDVLSYNTHLNGLIANMAINESFLGTAQLRSSVLAHAESLGYTPKSSTASTAVVTATVAELEGETNPEVMVLNPYTEFLVDVDEVSYSFKTIESYTATNENGVYTFKNSAGSPNITLKEGTVKRKTFAVGDNSDNPVFVIPDTNIDTTTISVSVYNDFNTTEFTVYNHIDNVRTINDESQIYLIRETSQGSYELQFSDGNTLGKAPVSGNKIVVDYMTTSGSDANGGFAFATRNISFGGNTYPVVVSLVAESAGGDEKESLESIKINAPRLYTTQQRLVTANDYESVIFNNYGSYLDGVIAWGGNENVPAQFGKVFVSLQFKEGMDPYTQGIIKQSIADELTSNLAIMSIETIFVEPEITSLILQATFNVDTTKSRSSTASLQTSVQNVIINHFNTELNTFDASFRRSSLLNKIDSISPAILNSQITVLAQQELSDIVPNQNKDYSIAFPFTLASPDKDEHIITSSAFVYKGQTVYIKNELGSNRLQLLDSNGEVKLVNTGTYDPAKGLISLSGLNVENATILKITAKPANTSTIRPLRNYIITLSESLLNVQSIVETDNAKAVL